MLSVPGLGRVELYGELIRIVRRKAAGPPGDLAAATPAPASVRNLLKARWIARGIDQPVQHAGSLAADL